MLAGAEAAARALWPQQLANACRMPDPVLGFRYRPYCASVMKTPEGPWYTNSYNGCGYRSDTPCGPLPAGQRRIAVIGTSLAEGHLVPYPDTLAARLAVDLGRTCGTPVDVQNLAAIGYHGDLLVHRMQAALRLRPDAVLFVTDPYDVEASLAGAGKAAAPPPAGGLQQRVFVALRNSRALWMAQHVLFRDPSIYLPLYLRYGDKADFLRPPFSALWRARLDRLDALVAALAARAHRAGVPLMVAFVPQAAQLGLMTDRTVPPGVDPAALPAAIAAIAARHGAWFADTAPAMSAAGLPADLFYIVDGHPSAAGQRIIAAAIAQGFVAATASPFADCHGAPTAAVQAAR
jgi:hypothetical protein